MKIVFTGLPYFGKKLVKELSEFDKNNSYVFCDTYYSKLDRFKFVFHLLTADRVVSINGVSMQSGSLDWVIKRKKKLILQWQGTDVLTAINNANGRGLNRKYIDYATSYTDAEWLKAELSTIGVHADMLYFKHLVPTSKNKPFESTDAISYIAEGKEKFYGIDHLIHLAKSFPQIKFHIIGTKGNGIQVPINLIFYGWLNKESVTELMDQHPVFIRLTEHDGYALSVMEAIANGNYVLWNHPHPCVTLVKETADLTTIFSTLLNQIQVDKRARKQENSDWAKTYLNKNLVLMLYISEITRN